MASLFGFDLSAIFDAIKKFLGPFGKLIDQLKTTWDHLTNVVSDGEKLVNSVVAEIDGWRNFKSDIRIAQRVIQIERAVNQTRALIEGIPESWRKILDIVKQFKEQIAETNPATEAELLVEDVETAGSISALLKKFPRLAKALERVLGVLAIVVQSLEAISNTIRDLQFIVDELRGLRLEIEKLDTIFLSQSNKRKTLRLTSGKTIRIRLGKLHRTST